MTTTIDRLVVAATVLSLGHPVDHVLRGNHTGWPVVQEVTPFTISLLLYPVIAVEVLLGRGKRGTARLLDRGRRLGSALLRSTHLGPTALEPPGDIVGEYATPPLVGHHAGCGPPPGTAAVPCVGGC